ncbi:hypothetical protein [Prevotella sp. Rep29]|uniref:hypothetical protein n=1 Tax=Prevotella sp. Rep29 TaxID=2691580 RepID=UPI001C6DDAF8|nr:hypothetical protein [Prevotella sp. Rep29]QYR11278.1 hypothetical protein GRF55_09400 [Prevotella sp. Rep29]
MKQILISFAVLTVMMVSCRPSAEERGEKMLRQIESAYQQGQYDEALVLINSLRRDYPKAFNARKKALRIYQNAVLKKAQKDLMHTDTFLQRVNKEYEQARIQAEAAKQVGTATAQQLSDVTRLRILRDSLQVRFDTQVARIRFIHKKQKEN